MVGSEWREGLSDKHNVLKTSGGLWWGEIKYLC